MCHGGRLESDSGEPKHRGTWHELNWEAAVGEVTEGLYKSCQEFKFDPNGSKNMVRYAFQREDSDCRMENGR